MDSHSVVSGTSDEMAAPAPNASDVADLHRSEHIPDTASMEASASRQFVELFCGGLAKAAMGLVVASVVLEACLIVFEVIARKFFSYSVLWIDQTGTVMLALVAFLGGSISYYRDSDVRVTFFRRAHSSEHNGVLSGIRDGVTLGYAVTIGITSWQFITSEHANVDPLLHISEFWLNLPLPIGMFLISAFALRRLVRHGARGYRLGNVLAVAVCAIGYASQYVVELVPAGGIALIPLIGVCALALFAGLPLALVFGAGSFEYLHLTGLPLITMPLDMTDGVASFVLVAIPFFLATGYIMSYSVLGDRLTEGIHAFVRRWPGGVLHVIVVSMFVMSGISGSKMGDMAAVGGPAVRMAKKAGHTAEDATAVLVAGAIMGDTIPPSTALLVLSSVTALPIGALFAAGLLPAVVTGVGILATIYLKFRRQAPVDTLPRRQQLLSIMRAVPVATVPIFMIVGIVAGIAAPSEIGAVAILYTALLAAGPRSRMGPKDMYNAVSDGVMLAGGVLMIVATATVFARLLTISQVPQQVSTHLVIGGRFGFLALSSLLLILLGVVMEVIPCLLVTAPILLPIASSLNVNPIQMGILLVMAVGIGANWPPIGIGPLVAARISDVDAGRLVRPMMPYLVVALGAYVLSAAIPSLEIWLPHLWGLG